MINLFREHLKIFFCSFLEIKHEYRKNWSFIIFSPDNTTLKSVLTDRMSTGIIHEYLPKIWTAYGENEFMTLQ